MKSPHLYRLAAPADGDPSVVERAIALDTAQSSRGVRPVYTLNHLAQLTETPLGYLESVVSRNRDPYAIIELKKRDGRSSRSVAVPDPDIKRVQRWLLDEVFGRMTVHPSAFAYVKGRSAIQAAQAHLGARWIVKLDAQDFFHQFDESQVYWLLRRHAYTRLVALEIARLVTRHVSSEQSWLPEKYSDSRVSPRLRSSSDFDLASAVFGDGPVSADDSLPHRMGVRLGYVPQGAPTSGAVSNALSFRLDVAMQQIADTQELAYSRYADDIVFSSVSRFSRARAECVVKAAVAALLAAGLQPNARKTRVFSNGSALEVLGVRIDGRELRLGRRTKALLEFHVRGIGRFGVAEHAEHAGFRDSLGLLAYVHGLVRYAYSVDPVLAAAYTARLPAQLPQD